MEKQRKTAAGATGLLVLGLTVAFAIGFITRPLSTASADTPATTAAQAQATAAPATDTKKADTAQQYANLLTANFASRLGITQAKLDSAFSGAVNDTADQAVRDGKVSQGDADRAKAMAQKGFGTFLMETGFGTDQNRTNKGAPDANMEKVQQAMWKAAGSTLGLTSDQVMEQMKNADKSLADLARDHQVDPEAVKTAMVAAARAQLSSLVSSGAITQAQSDEYSRDVNSMIDKMMSVRRSEQKSYEPADNSVLTAAWEAGATKLGLDGGQLKEALGTTGKSLADLATEHHVDAQELRTLMLNAGQAKINALAQAGSLTQAQATDQKQGLTEWLDSFFNRSSK